MEGRSSKEGRRLEGLENRRGKEYENENENLKVMRV